MLIIITIQKVELDSSDLVFVGDIDTVGAYAVITANNTFQSSTMCVNLRFHGGNYIRTHHCI